MRNLSNTSCATRVLGLCKCMRMTTLLQCLARWSTKMLKWMKSICIWLMIPIKTKLILTIHMAIDFVSIVMQGWCWYIDCISLLLSSLHWSWTESLQSHSHSQSTEATSESYKDSILDCLAWKAELFSFMNASQSFQYALMVMTVKYTIGGISGLGTTSNQTCVFQCSSFTSSSSIDIGKKQSLLDVLNPFLPAFTWKFHLFGLVMTWHQGW